MVVAVGTCKSCNKGLCPACAVDLGKGLACKGKCEEDVVAVIRLIERNIKLSPASEQLVKTASSNRYIASIFYIVLSLVFLGFGTYHSFQSGFESPDILVWGFGLCILIFGLITLQRAVRYSRPNK